MTNNSQMWHNTKATDLSANLLENPQIKEIQVSCGQRSGKQTRVNNMRNGASIPGVADNLEINMAEFLARDLCQKCNGERVKRHHRKCAKRGLGHKGRGRDVEALEMGALWTGLVIHIRRGRHGKGLSVRVAREQSLRALAPRKYVDPLYVALTGHFGHASTIESPEPGTITVTTDKTSDATRHTSEKTFNPDEFKYDIPLGFRVIVNGVDLL